MIALPIISGSILLALGVTRLAIWWME